MSFIPPKPDYPLKAKERHGILENSQLFGLVVEKRDFAQITLFRTKCSKMGQKPIGTIKSTTFFFTTLHKMLPFWQKMPTKSQGI